MENNNWSGLEGGFVTPFCFSEEDREFILQEAAKHILDESLLPHILKQLEIIAETYKHLKEVPVHVDTRRIAMRKLDSAVNAVTKLIDVMQSFDATEKEACSRYLKNECNKIIAPTEPTAPIMPQLPSFISANPIPMLTAYLQAMQSQLNALSQGKHLRADKPIFVFPEILKWWFRYTDRNKFHHNGKNAWLDSKAGKCNSAVSLMLITKTLLAACGTHISNPTNHIMEAAEQIKN